MIKVYTSYFSKLRVLSDTIKPIAICGKAPQGWGGLEYKKFAPKYSFFAEWKKTGDNDYYIEHFNDEVLSCLKAKDVMAELTRLSGGADVVLICYEKPDNFCHRHLVAKWLSEQLGIEVIEIG